MRDYFVTYKPSFQRHMWSLEASGFYTRGLDADDVAFIENIRTHGRISSNSLGDLFSNRESFEFSGPRPALAEEAAFWESPWEIEPDVERRLGTGKPKPVIDEVERAYWAKRKQQEAARRAENKRILEEERKRVDAEWQEQQEALAKEREKRLLQTMQADLEWEAAHPRINHDGDSLYVNPDPPRRMLNGLPERHYVPEWKRAEVQIEQLKETQKQEKQELKKAQERAAKKGLERPAQKTDAATFVAWYHAADNPDPQLGFIIDRALEIAIDQTPWPAQGRAIIENGYVYIRRTDEHRLSADQLTRLCDRIESRKIIRFTLLETPEQREARLLERHRQAVAKARETLARVAHIK